MAKTHLSLSHDPELLNAPTDFTLPVRDLRAYTGAGWIVALCGDMQTMPGYGVTPAFHNVDIDAHGTTARPVLRRSAPARPLYSSARRGGRHRRSPARRRAAREGGARAGCPRPRTVKPGLATILTGDDYAAHAYERRLRRIAGELGCRYVSETLPGDVEEADMLALVGKLNADPPRERNPHPAADPAAGTPRRRSTARSTR